MLTMAVAAQQYVQYRKANIRVVHQDTSAFATLADMHDAEHACSLIDSVYQMCLDQVPKLIADKKIKSAEVKLTIYSLYKQIEEGNAPPPSERPAGQDETKYNVWR